MAKAKTRKKSQSRLRLFRCDWPNGNVSFVLARSHLDAIWELDEVDGAEEEMLTEVDTFQVHFALERCKPDPNVDPEYASEWCFQFEGFGEQTDEYMAADAAAERQEQTERGEQINERKKRLGTTDRNRRGHLRGPTSTGVGVTRS
jgi:hypothetical protein